MMCIITIIIKTLYAMRIDTTIDVNSHSLFFTHSLNVLYNRISTISISPITIPINNIVNISFAIIIPPYFHKTLCRINRIRAYTLVCLLLVFRNLCCGTHNNSIWIAILSTYGLLLVYLSQVKSIQPHTYIRLLSLA